MMLLAAICLAIAVAAVGGVLFPLLRRLPAATDPGQFERAVYRDQIAELEQEAARGLVPPDAAASARLQIERRLLAAAPTDSAAPMATARRSYGLAAVVCFVLLLVPAVMYLRMGAPRLPDQPFASRSVPEKLAGNAPSGHEDVDKSLVELAAKLKADPDNAEQWMLYARTAATVGKWERSMEGYRQLLRLAPGDADALGGYGEMQVMAADGIVTPGAREAFNGALAKDPRNNVARFYLALADAQAGELPKAIDAWVKLAADVPDDTDMREEIARRVAEAAKLAGVAPPPLPAGRAIAAASAAVPVASAAATAPPAGGPDAAAVAAAANMAPEQRDTMIAGMVKQLADRLDKNPDDADGWLKLGRAYLVLKQPNKAADAYNRAAQMRPADPGIKLLQASALLDSLDKDVKVPDQVVQLLQQAQAADPNRPEVYWYLGIAAAHGGNRDDARQQWQHVLSMLPAGDEDRGVVQDAINSLN